MKSRAKAKGHVIGPEFQNFSSFLEIMGEAPSPEHSLDRIDNNNKAYTKTNCRWANKTEQANNRSNSIKILFEGVSTPLAEVARRTNQNYQTLLKRRRNGFSDEEIINGRSPTPPSVATTATHNYEPWRWVGTDTQIDRWRSLFLGQEETDFGAFPYNDKGLSFPGYVHETAEMLLAALDTGDYSKLKPPFTEKDVRDAPNREETRERLNYLGDEAFKRMMLQHLEDNPLAADDKLSSPAPWTLWEKLGEDFSMQELAMHWRNFTKTARISPPKKLQELWEKYKHKLAL
ncbi:hypothetical protein [Brucella pseudogrignonensis]|uniref:hypothetical protein n=1 Tax=Brucella pseudogrignonensis TaxID=419475 RepID=UPI003D98788F